MTDETRVDRAPGQLQPRRQVAHPMTDPEERIVEIEGRLENDYAKFGADRGHEASVYFDAEQAHADIAFLLEVARAARDVVNEMQSPPYPNLTDDEESTLYRLRDALHDGGHR